MSLRYSFFAIVPDGIIKIPQDSNLSWLTLFYALPRELVEKYPPALSLPRNIYELLDDPDSMEVIKNDMFLLLVWDCFAWSAWQFFQVPNKDGTYKDIPGENNSRMRFVSIYGADVAHEVIKRSMEDYDDLVRKLESEEK